MTPAVATVALVAALLMYAGASALFFVEVLRGKLGAPADIRPSEPPPPGGSPTAASSGAAPLLLGLGAVGHAVYVTLASFAMGVCPVHSVHFILSIASLVTIGVYLAARRRYRIHALGLLVSPLALAFLLGTWVLGRPGPELRLSPTFIALHVLANLSGVALFLLAGLSAALYLVQERRLKQKKLGGALRAGGLPPLDALDRAVHRFLIAGFPLLTLGIVTGTFWARRLELGSADEVLRAVFGYSTWLLIAAVLLLRGAAGWRGRRAALGTLAGLSCAMVVLVTYLARPAVGG